MLIPLCADPQGFEGDAAGLEGVVPEAVVDEPEALFGASIDTMGDLDGDGIPELLVGAPGMHELKGEAYIISMDREGK